MRKWSAKKSYVRSDLMEGKKGFALCAEGILSITTNQRNTYTRVNELEPAKEGAEDYWSRTSIITISWDEMLTEDCLNCPARLNWMRMKYWRSPIPTTLLGCTVFFINIFWDVRKSLFQISYKRREKESPDRICFFAGLTVARWSRLMENCYITKWVICNLDSWDRTLIKFKIHHKIKLNISIEETGSMASFELSLDIWHRHGQFSWNSSDLDSASVCTRENFTRSIFRCPIFERNPRKCLDMK